MSGLHFNKPVLVYIPCYNCGDKIAGVIDEIPRELHDKIECLIVDNQSSDNTVEVAKQLSANGSYPFKIHLVRLADNMGYAGSQKFAYYQAVRSDSVKKVIMYHGDGQYPGKLLGLFLPYLNEGHAIVNGFRSKREYPRREETPPVTYFIIKFLSLLESLLLRIPQREWHSGFVMYSKEFLAKVPVQHLGVYRHIDGEFLMCAGILKEKTFSVPIYKRYKDYEGFGGWARIRYILQVFRVIFRCMLGHHKRILNCGEKPHIPYEYEVINTQGITR